MAVLCLCAVSLAAGYGAHSPVSGGGHAGAPPVSHTTVTVTTTTPVTTTPLAPAPDRRTISIAAVGDTMLGSTPQLPPSPGTYLAAMRADLHGDVFGNLEGTLTDATTMKCKPKAKDCFAFRVPPELASDLRAAGLTVMNNANNHSDDFGPTGQADTVQALRAAGIAQAGLPGEITVVRAGGLRVGILGFAPYSATASLLDLSTARALIQQADAKADIVIVALHAGAEGTDAQHVTGAEERYVGEDRGHAEAFAHMAVMPAPTFSSAPARTSCGGWRCTTAA